MTSPTDPTPVPPPPAAPLPAAPRPAEERRTWKLRAIISDIHANNEALEAVLRDIEAQHADQIICLGDLLGYGPEPIPILKAIRQYAEWSLCGNHDAVIFMNHSVGFNAAAAAAVAWHRSLIRPTFLSPPDRVEDWRWMESLPSFRFEGSVLYVHASPRDPLVEYVLEEDFQDMGFGPSEKVVEIFQKFESLCFVGHSHRPGIATHDFRWIKPAELQDLTYILPPGQKTLVNIGAVGQPRDRNTDACYVLYDGESIRFRRVPYDIAAVQAKIRAHSDVLDPRLADRLAKGS
jgi:diadenosine tetraphosphatase ApaH/serine/threonine PP2A family protein phosphatase